MPTRSIIQKKSKPPKPEPPKEEKPKEIKKEGAVVKEEEEKHHWREAFFGAGVLILSIVYFWQAPNLLKMVLPITNYNLLLLWSAIFYGMILYILQQLFLRLFPTHKIKAVTWIVIIMIIISLIRIIGSDSPKTSEQNTENVIKEEVVNGWTQITLKKDEEKFIGKLLKGEKLTYYSSNEFIINGEGEGETYSLKGYSGEDRIMRFKNAYGYHTITFKNNGKNLTSIRYKITKK